VSNTVIKKGFGLSMLKLQEASLEWALKSINKYNDTYIFPRPFEFDAINEYWSDVKIHLLGMDVFSKGIRPYRRSLTPKSELGFRISTQLDPLDTIISHAIIYEIHKEIENARLPKDSNKVFSFRLEPKKDGTLYDENYNWQTFKKEAECQANNGEYDYVVLTDIADCFPSIYLHNIETVLRECVQSSGKKLHVESLINIIKAMHINQTHKGLPVGPQFARPIAELILNDVDKVLYENDVKFIRYVDDYRIFCKSESDAYNQLFFLSQNLYDLTNLKLNESKTKILPIDIFKQKYINTEKEREKKTVFQSFKDLLEELEINPDSYEEIDISSLDEEDLIKLHSLNLENILNEELEKGSIDFSLMNFLLINLARIDNTDIAEIILSEKYIRRLFPILKFIIDYLERIRSFDVPQKMLIGKKILDLLEGSFVGTLEFNKMWMLSLFIKGDEWDNQETFSELIKTFKDNGSIRKLYLALGRSKNITYFRRNKTINLNGLDPWVKRAFIASISCLPDAERTPWYKARRLTSRDFLDEIVEKWAEKNHF
jgi:hypothetical protein